VGHTTVSSCSSTLKIHGKIFYFVSLSFLILKVSQTFILLQDKSVPLHADKSKMGTSMDNVSPYRRNELKVASVKMVFPISIFYEHKSYQASNLTFSEDWSKVHIHYQKLFCVDPDIWLEQMFDILWIIIPFIYRKIKIAWQQVFLFIHVSVWV